MHAHAHTHYALSKFGSVLCCAVSFTELNRSSIFRPEYITCMFDARNVFLCTYFPSILSRILVEFSEWIARNTDDTPHVFHSILLCTLFHCLCLCLFLQNRKKVPYISGSYPCCKQTQSTINRSIYNGRVEQSAQHSSDQWTLDMLWLSFAHTNTHAHARTVSIALAVCWCMR